MRSLVALRRAVRADPIPAGVIAISAVGVWGMIEALRNCRLRVEGDSMRPLLVPGDRVVLAPVRRRRLQPGDLVVVRDPRRPQRRMIKRVTGIDDARAWVRGDNPEASTDSRAFGWVPLPRFVARPVRRYAPASRAGPLHQRGDRAAAPPDLTTTPPAAAAEPAGGPGRTVGSRAARRGR